MGVVLADAAPEREGLARGRGRMGRLGVVHDIAVQPLEERVQNGERVIPGLVTKRPGIIGNRGIRRRQRRLAQKQRRRKALDRTADEALGVLGLDLALHQHRELGERAGRRERVSEIAERVLVAVEPALLRQVDAPVGDILAIMVARGQAEHLNDARRRALVAVSSLVGDPNTHAASRD